MKLYGAIDLHSNNNVTVVIDEQDHVVYEKRLPNDLAVISQQLSAYHDSLQGIVVITTGTGWSKGCWIKDTNFIWPTPLQSSSTKDSSTPTTSPMLDGSPIF